MTSTSRTPDTPAREGDDGSRAQLAQLVGLVDYDESADPFPVKALDAVVFVVGNATQTAWYYQAAFGMRLIAYYGPETGQPDHKSFVLESGSARFVVTGGTAPNSPLLDHHRRHGDGVVDLALEVDDVDRCVQHARAQGATSWRTPTRPATGTGPCAWPRSAPMATPGTA